MSLCGKVSNNKHFGCPARMDDARHFTDYKPNCHLNNVLRTQNQILNSYDYRMYLTNNASQLMDYNRKLACDLNCCSSCMQPYDVGTMLPEKKMTQCSATGCVTAPSVFEGIGTGRRYSDEEEVCPGVNNMNDMSNCCAPYNDLSNYYPDSKIQDESFGARLSMPSGGKLLSGGDPAFYN